MKIDRYLENYISKDVGKQKVILLFGSRRTGKSTLIENISSKKENTLLLQGEDMNVQSILQNRTIANYQNLIQNKKLVIIDEAQSIPEIGKILKLMIDNLKPLTIIATGSSSFDLQNASGEPLVGRNKTYKMFPIAQAELAKHENILDTKNNLEERLIYGSYPELWHLDTLDEKTNYLKQLVNNYLLKDILVYEEVKGSAILLKLLQLLAYQVGSTVSNNELSKSLGISKNTVDRYLDLLSKVYIIFSVSGFSRNLRKEITKSKKWYFYDNGIRNALIHNFSPLALRQDVGILWEQYAIYERIKYNASQNYFPEYYFWRTYDRQEIDWIEVDANQEITAIECKYKERKVKVPVAFEKAYPEANFHVIHQNNYLDFIQ